MTLPPALVRRFVAHLDLLRGDLAALQPALTNPALTDPAADAREKLRSLSHQLAGTADGYGFSVVGACARRVEAALAQADPVLADVVRALADAVTDAVGRGGAG